MNTYDEVPYRVLCFLTSYINYGGRVTDYIDIRTIDVIMKSFYKPEIFEKDYAFDSSGTYKSIEADPEAPHASYMDYIETLPLTAGPSIFGMHENANISCAFAEAFGMFDTLLSLEASGGGGGGGGNDDVIAREVDVITEKLSKRGAFDIQGIQMQYPVVYEESMNTVLAQECIRYNKLVGIMELTLPELAKALQGLVVMSGELEAMGNSIAVAGVPSAWEAKAYPSLKPLGPWTDDLMERLDFIRTRGCAEIFHLANLLPRNIRVVAAASQPRRHRDPSLYTSPHTFSQVRGSLRGFRLPSGLADFTSPKRS